MARETLSIAARDIRVGDLIYDPEYPHGESKWRPVRTLGECFGSVALHLSYRTFTKGADERVTVRRAA